MEVADLLSPPDTIMDAVEEVVLQFIMVTEEGGVKQTANYFKESATVTG